MRQKLSVCLSNNLNVHHRESSTFSPRSSLYWTAKGYSVACMTIGSRWLIKPQRKGEKERKKEQATRNDEI